MVFSPLFDSVDGLASISKQVILSRNADSSKDALGFEMSRVYGLQVLHSVLPHHLNSHLL